MTSYFLMLSILSVTASQARVARRAADGGHVKFSDTREGRGILRSGGRVPITYSGACDNSGYRCGRPAVSPHEMVNHRDGVRVPKVRDSQVTGETKDDIKVDKVPTLSQQKTTFA